MYERVVVSADGRVPAGTSTGVQPADSHRHWLHQRLIESPASLQDVTLQQLPEGTLAMEWQAVFQGAGVAYIQLGGVLVAACLLLEGKHVVSENAAIDALQQTLQLRKAPGFEQIRRMRARPIRALVLLQDLSRSEIIDTMVYWADCLATAYFGVIATGPELNSGDTVTMRAV